MAIQTNAFLSGEADSWYSRNKEHLTDDRPDRALEALVESRIKPQDFLEIGCSNGWRLRRVAKQLGCRCYGVEPSKEAVAAAARIDSNIDIRQGTADALPFPDQHFDAVLYGYCLCICDRSDLFRIAAEGDRVLKEGGHLVIADFFPPFAYKNTYSHVPGLYTYKMDYSRLFLANPAYQQVFARRYYLGDITSVDEMMAVIVLKKSTAEGYSASPFQAP